MNINGSGIRRLSVDIDLNYTGSVDREQMAVDRPKIEQACQAVFSREGFSIKRLPVDHAGGKWKLSYASYTGQPGILEVDFNFMYRQPLWNPVVMDSVPLGQFQCLQIPVLDPVELAAGKLAALLARAQARDFYDAARIFDEIKPDKERLRIAFIVYGTMNRVDWRTISPGSLTVDSLDLMNKLIPVLQNQSLVDGESAETFGAMLLESCRIGLDDLLPFRKHERQFLDALLDDGVIDPGLLTDDPMLRERIEIQPLLQWKALNVREHRGIT